MNKISFLFIILLLPMFSFSMSENEFILKLRNSRKKLHEEIRNYIDCLIQNKYKFKKLDDSRELREKTLGLQQHVDTYLNFLRELAINIYCCKFNITRRMIRETMSVKVLKVPNIKGPYWPYPERLLFVTTALLLLLPVGIYNFNVIFPASQFLFFLMYASLESELYSKTAIVNLENIFLKINKAEDSLFQSAQIAQKIQKAKIKSAL